MTTPSPSSWKTVVLKFVAFGAGFAVTLSAISGALVWYSKRPKTEKPWNQSAIKATSTKSLLAVEADRLIYDFSYTLENMTERDYRVPGDAKLMVRLAKDMSYRNIPEMTWEQNLYIPSAQKVNFSIRLSVMYSDYDFSRQKADDEKQLIAFSDRRLAEIDGFGLFDPTARYKVELPNGWPEAAGRAKKQEESKAAKNEAK